MTAQSFRLPMGGLVDRAVERELHVVRRFDRLVGDAALQQRSRRVAVTGDELITEGLGEFGLRLSRRHHGRDAASRGRCEGIGQRMQLGA